MVVVGGFPWVMLRPSAALDVVRVLGIFTAVSGMLELFVRVLAFSQCCTGCSWKGSLRSVCSSMRHPFAMEMSSASRG